MWIRRYLVYNSLYFVQIWNLSSDWVTKIHWLINTWIISLYTLMSILNLSYNILYRVQQIWNWNNFEYYSLVLLMINFYFKHNKMIFIRNESFGIRDLFSIIYKHATITWSFIMDNVVCQDFIWGTIQKIKFMCDVQKS